MRLFLIGYTKLEFENPLTLLLLIPSLICLKTRLTPSSKRDKKVLIIGAGEGIRTLDFNLGKVALYP